MDVVQSKVASTIFQQKMDVLLTDCGFIITYLDDILVECECQVQHIEHIK